jgi:hypothetical protein
MFLMVVREQGTNQLGPELNATMPQNNMDGLTLVSQRSVPYRARQNVKAKV